MPHSRPIPPRIARCAALAAVTTVALGGVTPAAAQSARHAESHAAPPGRAAGGAGRAEAVRAEIERRNAAFGAAFASGDAAAVAALYTPDAEVLPPNSAPVRGREAITTFWKGAMGMGLKGARLQTVEVTPGGDVATEVGRYTLTAGDGTVADEGKYMVLWRRVGGAWHLDRDIWNTTKPAAPTK